MVNGTPREAAFLICLSEAYELAGRKVSDTTIMSAAREMAARIPCADSEIKELFVTAREIDNIPTIKVLWKAMDIINANRKVEPSNAIAYDKFNAMMRRINIQETIKMYAERIGRYNDYINAYATQKGINGKACFKNPEQKAAFDREIMPAVKSICGEWYGMSPKDPGHPVNKIKCGGR